MALQQALEIIKRFEGCKLKAYPDPGTGAAPWTIGWGATYYEDDSKVKQGDIITQERADVLLSRHVTMFLDAVAAGIHSDVNDNQLAAVTSFAYNCGMGNLRKSTLLKKVNANPNDPTIRQEFEKWNKAAGKVLNGLTKRRKAEADLYFS